MDKPKQLNIKRRLISAFSILVLIFILFGLLTIYDIHTVSRLTRTIYDHPLVVSNAALKSTFSITKMHREMKDVVLLTSPSKISRAIEAVNEQERQVYTYLDMVKDRIIGNEGKILENEARKLFDNWRPIREEIIELVRRGEKEIAAGITIGKGASHVSLLEEKMIGLTAYAREKAADFMHETEKVQSRWNLALIMFLLLGILASLLVAFFTIRRTVFSEKALQESEERYRSLVENQTDLVCRFTPDGTLVYVNDAYCHFSEKTKDELIGKKWHPLPVSDDVQFIQEKLLTLSPSNPTVIIENRIFSGKGDIHWMQFLNSGLFDLDGNLMEIQSVGRDITELKQTEAALKKSERDLSIKNRIAEIFLTIADEQMYGEVLQAVLEALESPYGTFAYINEDGDRVVPSMTRDIWDECKMPDKGIFFPRDKWGDTLWARCIIEKKSFSSNGPFKIPDGHMPIRRALASPIIYRREVIGNLMVGDKPTDYSDKDKELLETITDHIAPILHARLLNERNETERKRALEEKEKAEQERIRYVEELQKALQEVKQLSGLLPICSSCKKIRDDKGYWNQIENYIHDHSEAEFSHGICPDCAKKLYPEFDLYPETK